MQCSNSRETISRILCDHGIRPCRILMILLLGKIEWIIFKWLHCYWCLKEKGKPGQVTHLTKKIAWIAIKRKHKNRLPFSDSHRADSLCSSVNWLVFSKYNKNVRLLQDQPLLFTHDCYKVLAGHVRRKRERLHGNPPRHDIPDAKRKTLPLCGSKKPAIFVDAEPAIDVSLEHIIILLTDLLSLQKA